jgi:hypothetical protein
MDHYAELEDKQREEMRKRRREYFTRIADIVRMGIDAKQFGDLDPELATLAFTGMSNWAYKWYPRMADKVPPEEMAKRLCHLFLNGLYARP